MDNRGRTNQKQKKHSRASVSTSVTFTWLGLSYLFQTFEDLESVKDVPSDIQAIHEVLEEN